MRRIVVWTTYYNPNDETRNSEFIRCLQINSKNPYISAVYVLSEVATLPLKHVKLRCIHITKRPSYNNFFEKYKQYEPNSLNVLLNTDIVLDYRHTTRLFNIKKNQFLALTRYEFMTSSTDVQSMEDILKKPVELFGNHELLDSQFYYSQDTWVMIGYPSVSGLFVEQLGVQKCDGRIALHFNTIGYEVYNPCLSIFTYHVHENKDRSYSLPPCKGNVAFVRPTNLGSIIEDDVSQIKVIIKEDETDDSSQPIQPPMTVQKKSIFPFLRI
jgi:hypothetical protein